MTRPLLVLAFLVLACLSSNRLYADNSLISIDSLFSVSGDETQNRYQSIVDKYSTPNGPGIAVLVSRNGKILYKGAAGLANIELDLPLTTKSAFRIGSLTKQFTAAAIMMLQEQGKLSLQDDIHKYIPDFPTEKNTVTIEHLLNHTSGIANYTNDIELLKKEVQSPKKLNEVLERFAKHPMVSNAGEAMQYSNTGYVLLGKIIEVASGQPYSDFIEKNIFKKLSMKSSHFSRSNITSNEVNGYDVTPQGFSKPPHIDMSWVHAAGALRSSVEDLDIWFNALRSGKLISNNSYQQMITPFKLNDGSLSNYGFGLAMSNIWGYEIISHDGGIPGFTSNSTYLPNEDLYVAVLANASNINSPLISKLLIANALDIKLPKFESVELDETIINPLLGRYKIDSIHWEGKFFVENGKLYTQPDKGYKQEVLPMSNNSFYYENTLTYFVINKDSKGQYAVELYDEFSREPLHGKKR